MVAEFLSTVRLYKNTLLRAVRLLLGKMQDAEQE